MPMASTPIEIPSAAKHAAIALWGEPYDWLRKRVGPGLLMIIQAPSRSGQLWHHYIHFLRQP